MLRFYYSLCLYRDRDMPISFSLSHFSPLFKQKDIQWSTELHYLNIPYDLCSKDKYMPWFPLVRLPWGRNPVSYGWQCGPTLLSIPNGRGKVEGAVGTLVLLQVYFKQDLNSHDLLQGAPPGPTSQGRGAALGGVSARAPVTEPPLEQPGPHRFICHPLAGRAPRDLKAGSGQACSQACRTTAEEAGVRAGADLARWSWAWPAGEETSLAGELCCNRSRNLLAHLNRQRFCSRCCQQPQRGIFSS